MRRLSIVIYPLIILLFSFSVLSAPQDWQVSQYSKPGISLSFPSDWSLSDGSDAQSQNLALDRGQNEAKIVVMALREQMNQEALAQAQASMTRAILDNLTQSIAKGGEKAQESSVSVVIGGRQTSGVRLRTVLDGEPGRVDVYWLTVNNRLIHVILLGSNKALERASLAWSMVCSTLQIGDALMPRAPDRAPNPGEQNH
jgi:hypothetical protein